MRDYEELTAEWEEILETLRCSEQDLDAVKNLIFDTYWFLKADLKGDTIPRNRLELYKYIGLAAHAIYPISTGKLEGFNNKIKVTKRIGYGYRDDDFFFTLIRYLSISSVPSPSHNNP